MEHLPDEGQDIQCEPLYWVLPDGRCDVWSVRLLAESHPDQLVHASEETLQEAYTAVAQKCGYNVLGNASD